MLPLEPVILPAEFYRPRYSRLGCEIHDLMPWSDAITYVTDTIRVGVQFRDGSVRWLLEPQSALPTAESYRLVREDGFDALSDDVDPADLIISVWRENARVFDRRATGVASQAA